MLKKMNNTNDQRGPEGRDFSSKEDIVDYVTAGILPPSRKDFDRLMYAVRNPMSDVAVESIPDPENQVIIRESLMSENERNTLDEVMKRVYYNRVRNRNRMIVIAGAGIILAPILVCFAKRKDNDSYRDEYVTLSRDEVNSIKEILGGE